MAYTFIAFDFIHTNAVLMMKFHNQKLLFVTQKYCLPVIFQSNAVCDGTQENYF